MERAVPTPAVAADAAAVTELVVALESSLYGQTPFTQADLEAEWSELDLEQDARVVRVGDRVVGFCAVRERGELWRVEGFVHPDALGRGIGKLIATGLEEDGARHGARRIQNNVFEPDSAARSLLESLGYGPVRVFREMRIELEAPPTAPEWPDGLRVVPFDPERDALEFHAAHQEAFADVWDFSPRNFESWSKGHLRSERFDPTLWCLVRAGAGPVDRHRPADDPWLLMPHEHRHPVELAPRDRARDLTFHHRHRHRVGIRLPHRRPVEDSGCADAGFGRRRHITLGRRSRHLHIDKRCQPRCGGIRRPTTCSDRLHSSC